MIASKTNAITGASVKTNIDRSNPPLFMTRAEAALVSTLGVRGISEACARGTLRTVKVGGRRIIRLEDLEAFLARHIN